MADKQRGLYIMMFSLHGLIRSHDLEMGRDADTGGQIKYLLELAQELGKRPEVERVDLFTRLIKDRKVSSDYSAEFETITDKARIVRIPCGGGRYIRKELLWNFLEEFIDKTLKFIKREDLDPYLMHGHYADGGYVAMNLASLYGVPFVFTGHSLGLNKQQKLLEDGMSQEDIEKKFSMARRIKVEEEILANADLVFTSTQQEIEQQYGLYRNKTTPKYLVNPPGIDLNKFYPWYDHRDENDELGKQAREAVHAELNRFFINPYKPMALALCRPDKRKNVSSLIQAYGENKDLQAIANLAIFAGLRKNIEDLEENEKEVLTEILLLMDKYDLYGKIAIPKKHDFTYEVPELYRILAAGKGVFVNPALVEPFGLTLLESAACGAPVVATNNGGPAEIISKCKNGYVVDVSNPANICDAIMKIVSDKKLWEKLSANGIENVKSNYSWDAHVERYLDNIAGMKMRSIEQRLTSRSEYPIGRRMASIKKIIISDIDHTLTGDEESLQELLKMINNSHKGVGFGMATGRTIESTMKLLAVAGIPVPDVLITSVGSEIYYMGKFIRDNGWTFHIRQKWERNRIEKLLSSLPFLKIQENETQREFKLSYFMDPGKDRLQTINDILLKNRCRYNLVYSHDQFLDILPQRASKGKAIRYLSYKWEIPLENFLVAGDSGNDEEMLKGEPLGVVVGNYSQELEKLRGRRKVYFSKKNYAAGVIDGIRRYRFLDT
ncbi:MAG: HAD-IIB family hydrolase [Nitrospinales bacterium]